MILGIRHGERGDISPNPLEQQNVKLPHDPHLTKIGELQAQLTSKAILKKLSEYEQSLKELNLFTKKIQPVIISSPFLRTIQTSYHIAQGLGSIYQDSIFLKDDIMELLDDDKTYGYDQDPRPRLFSRIMKLEDFQTYGLDFINGKIKLNINELSYEEYKNPVYPESKSECGIRMEKFMRFFPKIFFRNFKFNEFALIFVTHQYCLAAGCWFLKKSNIQEFPLKNVGYCGILDCRYEDPEDKCEKVEVLQWGSNEHLENSIDPKFLF